MGFEVKDSASLDKALNGLGDAVENIKGALQMYDQRLDETGGSMAELREIVKDTQKQVEDSLRRHLPEKASRLLLDTDLEGALSWDALHKQGGGRARVKAGRRFEFERPDHDDMIGKWHDECDRLYLVAGAMKYVDSEGDLLPKARTLETYRKWAGKREQMRDVLMKDGFNIGTAGSGGDWDPVSFSGRFWEKARLPLQVENLIPSFIMPRSPFVFPVELANLTSYLVGEISTAPPILGTTAGYIPDGKGSTAVAGKKTFTSVKLATMAFASKEVQEDSIVAVLPYLEGAVMKAVFDGKEQAILSGDKTGTHQDTDVTAATDVRKAFYGLRYYGLSVASAKQDAGGNYINTDALWQEHIRGARKLMGDAYKGNAANLALIVSGNTAIDIGNCSVFRTAYAMGGMSTNRNPDSTGYTPDGLGNFVVSEFIRSDLGSAGVNAASGNNYTCAIQFYKDAWMLGTERNLRLEVLKERFAEYDVDAVKVTWRGDLQYMLAGDHTILTYDIAK